MKETHFIVCNVELGVIDVIFALKKVERRKLYEGPLISHEGQD